MIRYTLACRKDHVFEAWFAGSAAYDRQSGAGKIVCPVCGSRRVEKAPMAPSLARQGQRPSLAADKSAPAAKAREFLLALRKHVESTHDYVGRNFAEEARRIHHGEAEERAIYGETTPEIAGELVDEGILVVPVPWPPREDA